MPVPRLKTVFEFTDHRDFIRYRYAYLKKAEGLSFRKFSERAGFQSPNVLKLVIDGDRDISDESAFKFGKGLGLTEIESEYLMLMTSLNKTKNATKQRLFSEEMGRIKESLGLTPLD